MENAARGPGVYAAGPAVHVVYVNYHSHAYLRDSLASLAAHCDGVGVEVTVVDNSCDAGEAAAVEAMLPPGVRLLRAGDNLGFARACNLGARAGTARHLLFLNPDTVLLPDTLPRLCRELEARDGAALIGPRHYADRQCGYAHAPFRGVRLFDEAWDALWARGWSPRRSLRYLRRRAQLREATAPVAVRSISGGCLAVGRATFDALGGWDEGYWLYGEDLELCVRARRRGVPVLLLPDAGVVHFMEGSARHDPVRVARAREAGRRRYKHTRHGWWLRALDRGLTRALRWLPRRADPFGGIAAWDGEALRAPAACRRWAVEVARSPLFDNCLTAFPAAAVEPFSLRLLETLPPGTYYLRVAGEVAPGRWEQRQVYTVTKNPPAEAAS